MAYVFKEGKMASNQLDSMLANAKYYNAAALAPVKDGSFVVLKDLEADEVYANLVEYDTYKAEAPAAVTDEVVVVDYAGISEGEIMGNRYKIGNKLYGLTAPAGEIVRVRRLALHDKFWLGEDNFVGPVSEYAGLKVGDTRLDFSATPIANGFCIRIIANEDLTAGMKAEGKLYLCEVIKL